MASAKTTTKLTPTKYTGIYYRDTQTKDRVFYMTYKVKGKLIKKKVGNKSEGVTSAYANKMRAKATSIDRLKELSPLMDNTIPYFRDVAEQYFLSKSDKSDNITNKGRYKNHLEKKFANYKLDEITSDIINTYAVKKKNEVSPKSKEKYSPKTVNDMINLISTIFNYAINIKDIMVTNPASGSKVKRDKVDNARERYLEKEEIIKLKEEIKNRNGKDYVTERVLLFLAISLSTGARLNSVYTITKADVNMKHDTISIKNHKTDETYTGYINKNLKRLLNEFIYDLKPNDYVLTKSNHLLCRTSMNKALQPLLNRVFNEGLDKNDRKRRVVIHTFRHTFASLLAIQGTSIYKIKTLMNHSDIKQTMKYAKLQPDAGIDDVKGLDL